MPILRLAYVTLFLISLLAVYTLWSQVGGQGHLDLVAWQVKLVLGVAASFAITRAAMGAVAGERGWNAQSLKWLGLALGTLALCGLASYYAHLNFEDTGDEQTDEPAISREGAQKWNPVVGFVSGHGFSRCGLAGNIVGQASRPAADVHVGLHG